MKPDPIKRSVRAQRHDRSAGDAPSIGRVSRMPGTGLPKGEKRRRKKSEGKTGRRAREVSRRTIFVWSFLLCLGAASFLGAAVWFGLFAKPKTIVESPPPEVMEPPEKPLTLQKFPPPSEEEALALVRAGLAVRQVEQVPDQFRMVRSSPTEVVEFMANLEAVDGKLEELQWLGTMNSSQIQLEGVLVNFVGTDKPRNRLAFLIPDESGKWRIDFEGFARTSVPPVADLVEKRAESSIARIYVAPETYYNGPFSDDTRWLCFGIASPDVDQILLGYCEISSPQAAALQLMLSRDAQLTRAIVELKQVEGALDRQYLISKVLAEDWAETEIPVENRFK